MNPYDMLVMRHRFVQMYNGAGAWCIALYWYLYDNDRSCSKRNTTIEIVTFCNVGAHFIWDCIFMKWYGFLDFGNLMHHVFGIITYYCTLYQQFNMNFMMLHLLPGEFTNVSMHLREVFKRLGLPAVIRVSADPRRPSAAELLYVIHGRERHRRRSQILGCFSGI